MEAAVIPEIESWDIPYGKFRILFMNVFTILFKAATLSPRKLSKDLQTIQKVLGQSCCNTIVTQLYILFVSCVIFTKFLSGYMGLAAHIIAMFPILVEDGPEMLLPSILTQVIENVFFSSLDILIGFITVRYFISIKLPFFITFVARNIIQISIGVSVLNIYTDLYNNLKGHVDYNDSDSGMVETNETEMFLRKESLV